MNLIFTMSLAGSAAMAVYFISILLFRRRLDIHSREYLLKLAMLFFLFPFQLVKYLLPFALTSHIPGFYGSVMSGRYFDMSKYVAIPGKNQNYTLVLKWQLIMLGVGAVCAVLLLLRQIYKYCLLQKTLLKCSEKIEGEEAQEILEAELKQSRSFRRRKVEIFYSPAVKAPFTTGIVKPKIFLPETRLDKEKLFMVYRHELSHVRKRDVLVKGICLIVILLHWFNPLAYLLLLEFEKTAEHRCDEAVTVNLTLQERAAYARLIVQSSAEGGMRLGTAGLSGGKKAVRRRVEMIVRENTGKKGKKALALALMLLAFVCGLSSIYVYRAEAQMELCEGEDFENVDWMIVAPGEYSPNTMLVPNEKGEIIEITEELPDFSASDDVIISGATGKNFPIRSDRLRKASCSHHFVSGKRNRHFPNGKGGCTVYVFEGTYCTICGHALRNTLIEQHTYQVCPH